MALSPLKEQPFARSDLSDISVFSVSVIRACSPCREFAPPAHWTFEKEIVNMTQNCCDSNCCQPTPAANVVLTAEAPTPTHAAVREHYAERARAASSCDCGSNTLYDEKLLANLPDEIASFSLGCGDPITLANLGAGETVLDLGSGGGLDCFLAAREVGLAGRVIGVDMTPEMLAKARAAAKRLGAANVEFREGYLEQLPVEENSVDVVISNCVINLSPDKPQVFREVFRVLKPGGRIAVSDIVTNGQLPETVQTSMAAWGACIAGALEAEEYARQLREAGFVHIQVQPKGATDKALAALPIGLPFSATVTAYKPDEGEAARERQDEVIECAAPGGVESRRSEIEALMSRVTEITPLENGGYEIRLAGDLAETRALAETFIRDEATCCSFLHFDLIEAEEGWVLKLTGSPAAMEFAKGVVVGVEALAGPG
jgi:SAM-dependent methyltransferase